MGAVWRPMVWAACAAASLLAMGCGATAESGELEDDGVWPERAEAGELADEAADGGGSEGQPAADIDEAAGVDAQPIPIPIKCGSHFPLCPPGMECAPIRKVNDDIAFGYCK